MRLEKKMGAWPAYNFFISQFLLIAFTSLHASKYNIQVFKSVHD